MKEWILVSLYGSGTNTPFDITPIGAIWFLLASFWGSIFLKISLRMKVGISKYDNKETVWNSIGIGFFQNALKSVHRVIIHI